jgi:hypothetical protein
MVRSDQLRDLALFQQGLRLLGTIEDNRRERLESADGSAPSVLWLVLVAGDIITLGYRAFLGRRISWLRPWFSLQTGM